MTAPQPPSLPLQVEAAPDTEVGVYANLVSTWFTQTDVAVDFAAVLPSELIDTDRGEAVLPRARLVSRVRLAPSQAAELVRALQDALTRYEDQFGATATPAPRGQRPHDIWTV